MSCPGTAVHAHAMPCTQLNADLRWEAASCAWRAAVQIAVYSLERAVRRTSAVKRRGADPDEDPAGERPALEAAVASVRARRLPPSSPRPYLG